MKTVFLNGPGYANYSQNISARIGVGASYAIDIQRVIYWCRTVASPEPAISDINRPPSKPRPGDEEIKRFVEDGGVSSKKGVSCFILLLSSPFFTLREKPPIPYPGYYIDTGQFIPSSCAPSKIGVI